ARMPCCGESDPPHEAIRVLSQPQRHGSHGRKPWRCVRLIVMLLHALFIGAVFLLDPALRSQIRQDQWYMCLYGGLVLFTLAQYLYTANSSPGYVADMLKAGSAMHATFINTTTISKQVCSKNGSLNYFMSRSKIEQHNPQSATPSSLLQMMDLYPPGSSSRDLTCSYCHLIQVIFIILKLQPIVMFSIVKAMIK
uniref:S-acyltransferase n=1 Tax=Aegilops tauschii subsp. strangulata TaxID=200361 RepID=A0A453CMX9_AEGTS